MDALIETGNIITSHLWIVSWQASILIVIIGLVSFLLRSASPEFRYWLWIIVFIRLCIPFGLSIPLGFDTYSLFQKVEFMPGGQTPDFSSVPSALKTEQNEPSTVSGKELTAPAESSRRNRRLFVPAVILAWLWCAGVLSIGMVVLIRIIHLNRLLKKCPAVENSGLQTLLRDLCVRMGINRPVQLLYLDHVRYTSPAVAGFIRPCIFLPRTITGSLTPEELESILLHELAHIKRRDILANWIQVVIHIIYFFHPLVWLANLEIRRLREEVCDDRAIHYSGMEKERYARSIVAVLKHTGREPAFGFAGLGFTERRNSLVRRIKRIVHDGYRCRTGLNIPMITALLVIGVVSVTIACSRMTPDPPTVQPDYFPLKPGSEWTLEGISTDPPPLTFKVKVLGTEKINNILYSKIEWQFIEGEGIKGSNIFYSRCENNCVYLCDPPQKEHLWFDFNTEINQSWSKSITYGDSSQGVKVGRIISRNMTVKVPVGTFEGCIMYELTETRKHDERISTSVMSFI